MAKAASPTLVSAIGRVSFPEVFEASSYEGSDPKFGITLVYDLNALDMEADKTLQAMKQAANDAAMERFGCGIGKCPKGSARPIAHPFRKGEEKPAYYEEGQIFVKFTSKLAPGVVYPDRTPIEPTSRDFYAGCYARVSFTVYTYDRSGNKGVGFGLRNVQKVADGEPIGSGSRSAAEDFEDVSDVDVVAEAMADDDVCGF